MPFLYNRVSNNELRARMLAETEPRITVSFYKYFTIQKPQIFRDALYYTLTTLGVLGRIYIANEGINAQISILQNQFDTFRDALYNFHSALDQVLLNVALDNDGKSFWVLRMKVRARIVADGINDPHFNPANVGCYLKAKEVNKMEEDPETIFVDMRNHYEYAVGHFNKAIEIPSDTFRDQLSMVIDMLRHIKNKKIIIYCTGGIRCEKASAWMLYNGFKNIYHIEGGIIQYVRQARENMLPIKFTGKNFVFDARLSERITNDIIAYCYQCSTSCDNYTNCNNKRCNLLFIQCMSCKKQYNGCCSVNCTEELAFPAKEQRTIRIGNKTSIKIFNKAKECSKLY